jgi:hypothetical protein
MDCDNARLYLPYLTPGGKDLDGAEADELRAHLEQCSACNALAMNARRLDQHLGRAMRAVEVPVGMKGRILERLADKRRAVYRGWAKRAARVAAVAAGLLLAAWLGYFYWYAPHQNVINADTAHLSASLGPPDLDQVNAAFAQLGARKIAPDFVNYDYLVGEPALAELPGHRGKEVPQLVFVRPARKGGQPEKATKAIVYVIPTGQYPGHYTVSEPTVVVNDEEYRYKVKSISDPDQRCTYLILYDGNNFDWLRVKKKDEH